MSLVSVEGASTYSCCSAHLAEAYATAFSASGFTTRSDIGPAREGPSAEVIAYVTVHLHVGGSLADSGSVRHRLAVVRKQKLTRTNSKIQTMSTVSLPVQHMRQMTRKPTRYTRPFDVANFSIALDLHAVQGSQVSFGIHGSGQTGGC